MPQLKTPEFVVLCVLDGWGIASPGPGNAITLANTPNFKKFNASYPNTKLEAAGEAVGLPKGENGNTETGHINLGAGRIVYQDLERINLSIADGSYFKNKYFLSAIEHANKYGSNMHIIGLIGSAGVHSYINHLYALIHLISINNFKRLYLHIFTDGRDSPPTSSKIYINNIKNILINEKVGTIASIMGRYWAMDRDQRWDRTEKAYFALTKGVGKIFDCTDDAIEDSYSQGKTDEFIEPSLIKINKTNDLGLIKDNDAVIFLNFRIDRPRQLTKAFIMNNFEDANVMIDEKYNASKSSNIKVFDRGVKLNNLFFVTMTDYGKVITDSGAKVAFPPQSVENTLSSIISNNNFRQLKITESEKERFVTFYFNGLREKPFSLEDRIIIPSPKVPTYDQKPEMSAYEITNTLLKKLEFDGYKFILVNYPNPDIVGHTGNIGPVVKAVEVVDECIGKIANFSLAYEGALIITSDHGNAEELINLSSSEIDTEHSKNMVPFICVYRPLLGKFHTLRSGILADIAPTILSLMNIPVPSNMTGSNLLKDIILF